MSLKAFMRAVDRFCYRHPNFGVRNLMIFVVFGTAAAWLFSMMDTTHMFIRYVAFSPADILRGQIWRLLSFVLIPESSGLWLLLFLYFYYFIGSTLESHWGAGKFTLYYLFGILLNIIFGFLIYFITGRNIYLSANYINLAMFFAFATLFPETRVMIFFIIPIKIKWLGLLSAAYFLIEIVRNPFPLNLLPVVAILNYLLFCGGDLISFFRPAKARYSSQSVNFRKEARKIRRDQARQDYRHKCAVCGRTDTEYPDLEFRYCSRCTGYHCFCEDHINNHVHFTE